VAQTGCEILALTCRGYRNSTNAVLIETSNSGFKASLYKVHKLLAGESSERNFLALRSYLSLSGKVSASFSRLLPSLAAACESLFQHHLSLLLTLLKIT
jgi:hypothetical protein